MNSVCQEVDTVILSHQVYFSHSNDLLGENVQGNEVILEDLRQMCLFRIDEDLWWAYVVKFGQTCSQQRESNYDVCGDEVLAELKTEDSRLGKMRQCMSDSFKAKLGDDLKKALTDNTLLKANSELQSKMGVTHYPSLYANWNRYQVKIPIFLIPRAICSIEKTCSSLFVDTSSTCHPLVTTLCPSFQPRLRALKSFWPWFSLLQS